MLRSMLEILGPRLRHRFWVVESIAILSALVDAVAFVLLYPLFRILTSFESSQGSFMLRTIGDVYGTSSKGTLELFLGLTIIGIFICSSIIGLLLTRMECQLTADTEEEVSTNLFTQYMSVTYLDHISHNSAQLLRNTSWLPLEVATMGVLPTLQLTQNAAVIIFLLVLVAIVSPVVVLASLLYFSLAIYIYTRAISSKTRIGSRQVVEENGKSIQIIQEGFGGMKEFQVSNATSVVTEKYRAKKADIARLRYRLILYAQLPQYYLQSVMIGGLILFVIVVSVARPVDPAALIGLVVAASLRLLPALFGSLNSIGKIRSIQGNLEELQRESRRVRTASREGSGALILSNSPVKSAVQEDDTEEDKPIIEPLRWHREISFRSVSFTYPNSDRPALRDVSFTIKKGSFVGIIGPSGAGKSTITDMMLGLFAGEAGGVYVDDIPLTGIAVSNWRRGLGYVPQDVYLFDGSVRENVAFGLQPSDIDDEVVWDSLGRAQLGEEIRSLPEGLATVLGEKGIRLSGGQRQRIGIARALYQCPTMLILDEATSALDVATEAAVTETVEQLDGGLTRVVVAHRLSTVRKCDDLLLMKDGGLVGHGAFGDLRRDNSLFRGLTDLARID